MEEALPYSQWGEHFTGVAREFIAVIYLLGVLQLLVKVVMPVNVLPLIWGLRVSRWQKEHIFVLIVASSYLIAIYYYFINFLIRLNYN
jgi:hypothetical protein